MKRSTIDPGVLAVFRLFVGFRLVFSLVTLPVANRFEHNSAFAVGETLLLLIYLSVPWLAHKLGRFYLPIALGVATLGPTVENYILLDTRLSQEVSQVRAQAGQWQLAILLLVPIILMSWQYRFRIVAIYTLILSVLDGILTVLLIGTFTDRPVMSAVGVPLFRMLIFLLIAYSVSRLANDQRQQNTRLLQANRRLAASANTLEQLTISRERNRMARELHDTLAHSLSALAVQLEAVEALWETDPTQAHAMLDHSLLITRSGLGEARRAIQALRSAPLEDLGLNLALRNLATSEAEHGGFALDLRLPDEMPRLAPEVEHSLYRIAEEALRNVTRHAAARRVQVLLEPRDHDLVMVIKDDGCGFAEGAQSEQNHFGLKGMHERAEMIGAQLAIESRPGTGTNITLQMEENA
jgi:signal transduction histidine kinase